MSTKTPSRVVFVGNIPYGETPGPLITPGRCTTDHIVAQDCPKSRSASCSAAPARFLTFASSMTEIRAGQRALVSQSTPMQVSDNTCLSSHLPIYPVSSAAPLAALSNGTSSTPQTPQHQQYGT